MLLYLQAIVNRSGQATVDNHSTRAHHWNQTPQVMGKYPCTVTLKQHCGLLILQSFWLTFTFITQLVFNHLVVEWLNKGVKKHYAPALQLQVRGGLMQDTDIISIRHWGWTLLPIPHLLGDIIKTESSHLVLDCSCSVPRPVFLCSLIPSDLIFHGLKELQGWISLSVPMVSHIYALLPGDCKQQHNLKLLAL